MASCFFYILGQSCADCILQLVCGCLITFVQISTLLQVFQCWTGLQQQTRLLTCCYTTPGVMLLWAWHTKHTHTHFTHTHNTFLPTRPMDRLAFEVFKERSKLQHPSTPGHIRHLNPGSERTPPQVATESGPDWALLGYRKLLFFIGKP